MSSDKPLIETPQLPESTSDNRKAHPGSRRPGAHRAHLPADLEAVLARYRDALDGAPVDDDTRRAYASRVRQYLAWLQAAEVESDPLADPAGRDWAVRDYRAHLQSVAKRSPPPSTPRWQRSRTSIPARASASLTSAALICPRPPPGR